MNFLMKDLMMREGSASNMRPTRIFLDLDDVLNQFTLWALQRVGCPVGPWSYELFKPKWGFDIVRAANALHPNEVFTEESFWGSIGRSVWACAPRSEHADELLSLCAAYVGRENVFILSSPTLDPECLAGKLEWIQDELPRWIQRQYMFGPRKWICANPRALLIDDSDVNVCSFRGVGGQAITVPRPWNSLHEITDDDFAYVTGQLNIAFSGEP